MGNIKSFDQTVIHYSVRQKLSAKMEITENLLSIFCKQTKQEANNSLFSSDRKMSAYFSILQNSNTVMRLFKNETA